MAKKIVIDDLATPILTEIQKQVLKSTADMQVDFDVQRILVEACKQTGLDDFGSMGFLRRLTLLCEEWGNDSGLTNIGRYSLRNKLLLFSRNRLLVNDVLKKHPEIHEIEITQPLIVCGLPRSGTTHLLNVMAADRRLCSLPLWESYEPLPLPTLPGVKKDEITDYINVQNDSRYQRCLQQWQNQQQIMPLIAAMHPMNPDHIHEELELMGPDFASYNFEWLSHSPRWRNDYMQHDQTPHYDYLKTMLKIVQWQRGKTGASGRRWVLKCPQHLEQLPILQKTFPDATIVITHRDPVSVVQSAITMLAYGQRLNRKHVMLRELLEYWSDRIEKLLRACVRDRKKIPDEMSIDVPFDVFMKDDMAMIRRIYEKAKLSMSWQAEEQLLSFIKNNPRGKHGQVEYNLQRDFGVSSTDLHKRFGFYFDAFPFCAKEWD